MVDAPQWSSLLLKTGLYSWHVAHNGNIVDFAGWKLPVWFSSVKEKHMSVRSASGLFDTSHMGRFLLKGENAASFLEPLSFSVRFTLVPSWIMMSG